MLLGKVLIVVALLFIVFSLFRGLVSLVKGNGDPKQTVNALTWRIGLSLLLIIGLMIAIKLGYIEPHGVNPNIK